MLTASKNGRVIQAMTMSHPVDQCLGVVQCALASCEACMPIVADEGTASEQVQWFLEHHECRAIVATNPAKVSSS